MILITGLGRCGTSVLIKYLKKVGFYIGDCLWYDEIRAGYELPVAININTLMWRYYCGEGKPINLDDTIFNLHGRSWEVTYRQAITYVDKSEGGLIKVIKDPRLTWHPDIINAWWTARQDFKLIICHRDIESIMKSRDLMPGKSEPKVSILSRYKEDFADFFTKVLQLGIPYETLFFPNFLQDFQLTHKVLESVGLFHDYELGKEVWGDLVDQTLLRKT